MIWSYSIRICKYPKEFSEEDDDHVNNYLGFQVTFKMEVTGTVSNCIATTTVTSSNSNDIATCVELVPKFSEDFELDDSDCEEPSIKYIEEAY